MEIYASATHRLHDPHVEFIDGRPTAYAEQPARVDMILHALAARGLHDVRDAAPADDTALAAVHQPEYLAYLAQAADEWQAAGLTLPVMPSSWQATAGAGRSRAPAARAAQFISDLSAPITAATYTAARQSAGLALAGARSLMSGADVAYALCRPPGHHAGPARAAGYCFLNNIAVAAAHLSRRTDRDWALRTPTVAILDLDYHHGDGTQQIFAERNDVLCVSLHADPADEYPYFCGYADEIGHGAGSGYNHNFVLPLGCTDQHYLTALDTALETITDYAPRYLLVALGVDSAAGDPMGGFALTRALFPVIGQRLARAGLPTLFVQEGGYQLALIGELVADVLAGFTRERGGSR